MAPGILRDVGDIPQLAALASPRQLVIAGGVNGGGKVLSADETNANYAWTKAVFKLERSPGKLRIIAETSPKAVVAALSR